MNKNLKQQSFIKKYDKIGGDRGLLYTYVCIYDEQKEVWQAIPH